MSFNERLKRLPSKPDLIIIITDQERATQHFPDNWEQDNLHTMTFLKRHGFTFERAFCNSCMCSPSRATLFTGTYPAQHGVTQTLTWGGRYSPGEITLSPTYPNLARMLQPEGYDVQYRGKWHLSKGFTENGLTAADIALFGFRGWQAPDAGEDTKPENFGGGFANHDADYIQQGIDYLKEVKERRAQGDFRPYCLILSLVNPHDVLSYPDGVQYGYLPVTYSSRVIDLPQTVNEHLLEARKPSAQFQTKVGADVLLGPLPTDDKKLNYINFYGYTLKRIDTQIGTFVDELYKKDKANLSESAIVFRLSDHGEMGLAHGGMRQKAFNTYEETLRVPFVISNPVLFPELDPDKSTYNLATLIDVMPTIASIAGVETPPSGLKGHDLTPLIASGKPVQDSVLFTFDDTKASANNTISAVKAANRVRCIRTKEWKYSYYFHALGSYKTEYELYDLVNDHLESNNLAYNPDYAVKRAELAAQLQNLEETLLLIPAKK
ncbi:Arylsulfatase A [Pseudarcicella hirudinis]|uniref:Arylsulfatase A n=1 Tax=Pseudarcicella hirudinis TaxID=1079859 RepID=A0A1I5LYA1_9BACT|nr:sulfatase-like hydrolase/transferase [Pseudarcicella hirudinis]SFP02137.1 Arylsulfatase A [Pseudarcicella hirudinis]